jgi:predicted transcriptional regulator
MRFIRRKHPPLGDLEHELLTILWKQESASAATVRRLVSRELTDATIRTVLRRLEEKGYVTHTVEAGTFFYSARESSSSAAAKAVKAVADRFCGGSMERLLTCLVDASVMDAGKLESLAQKLKRRAG